jgi:hypothetical protein
MRGLDDLVRQVKIVYAGISDAPAWGIALEIGGRNPGSHPAERTRQWQNGVDERPEFHGSPALAHTRN